MLEVKLEIFWQDAITTQLQDLGVEAKPAEEGQDEFEDAEIREITFYEIAAVYDYKGEGKYTSILSSGEMFLANKPVNEVKKLIRESKW